MENFSCFSGNLSTLELTTEEWIFNPMVLHPQGIRYSVTILSFILLILAVPLNLHILISVVKKKLHAKLPSVVILINFAIINLLHCVFTLPLNIVVGITGEFSFGSNDVTRCRVCQTGVLFVTLCIAALMGLTLMSVDRLLYLKIVTDYHDRVTTSRITIATIGTWIYSVAVAFPPLVGFGEIRFSPALGMCTLRFSGQTPLANNIHYTAFLLTWTLVPFLILIIANTWVMCIAQKHLIKKYRRGIRHDNERSKSDYSVSQINLIKVYFAVFMIYFISWLPIAIRQLLGLSGVDRNSEGVKVIGIFSYLSLLSQVVINPTMQAFLIQSVRKNICVHVKKLNVAQSKSVSMVLKRTLSSVSSINTIGRTS